MIVVSIMFSVFFILYSFCLPLYLSLYPTPSLSVYPHAVTTLLKQTAVFKDCKKAHPKKKFYKEIKLQIYVADCIRVDIIVLHVTMSSRLPS